MRRLDEIYSVINEQERRITELERRVDDQKASIANLLGVVASLMEGRS